MGLGTVRRFVVRSSYSWRASILPVYGAVRYLRYIFLLPYHVPPPLAGIPPICMDFAYYGLA